jgi:hypothetical protein
MQHLPERVSARFLTGLRTWVRAPECIQYLVSKMLVSAFGMRIYVSQKDSDELR